MDIKAIVVGEITKQAEASVPQLKKAINLKYPSIDFQLDHPLSKSTLNKIRRVAKAMVDTKIMPKNNERESRNETFLRELYPDIQSELEQQAEQINLNGGNERVRKSLRLIMNVAEAKEIGAKIQVGVGNEKIILNKIHF